MLVRPGLEPAASRSADRRLSNWANRAAIVWWGGASLCPHHTNVCKSSRLWGALSSLVFNKSLSNLAIFTYFRALFPVVPTDFPFVVHVKSWKKNLVISWIKAWEKDIPSQTTTTIPNIEQCCKLLASYFLRWIPGKESSKVLKFCESKKLLTYSNRNYRNHSWFISLVLLVIIISFNGL